MAVIHDRLLTVSSVNGCGNAIKHHAWALSCRDCWADSDCIWG